MAEAGEEPAGRARALLGAFAAASRRGDMAAALSAADAACAAAPRMAEAHYARGQIWLDTGDAARAASAFDRAVRLRPQWADAWVNFGLARYRQGAVGEARAAMARALQAQQGHGAATANLAALMRLSGRRANAQALLREALERDPGNAGARLNLAAERLHAERPAEALALLDAAEPPADDPAAGRHWRLQRTLALIALGRAAEARAEMAEFDAMGPAPPELAPLRLWRLLLLAQAERRPVEARAAAAAMEAALPAMGPNAVLEHQVMARYDLAKYCSSQGDAARSFALWREGHALLRPTQPFSRQTTRAYAEAAMATFTLERLASGPRAQNLDAAPVFIVGMPRSGTTLCEQILGAHREVHAAGERSALGQVAWRLGGGEGAEAVARIAALPQAALDAEAEIYLNELRALAPGKARIVDKMPGNFLHVWLIALLFPRARVIHCRRDPRDIALSIFSFRFHGEHGYAHDLGDLGWMIGEQDRLMKHWTAAAPVPILPLRLDEWIGDFDATLAKTLRFLELPPDPACARFYEGKSEVETVSRNQVRRPINARGLGRWRPYAEGLAPAIAELRLSGALRDWQPT